MEGPAPNPYYPESLGLAESELLKARPGASSRDRPAGVGLSGGGIRSATFCLGFFQALARLDLLERVDYLSTVSGGGYFGSFFGRLFTRKGIDSLQDVNDVLNGPPAGASRPRAKRRVLGWLRENGRYLSPRGSGDLLLMAAVILRNWVALHVTLWAVALLAAVVLVLARAIVEVWASSTRFAQLAGSRCLSEEWSIWLSPLWLPAVAVFVLVAFPCGWGYWLLEWRSAAPIRARALQIARWAAATMLPALVAALVVYGLVPQDGGFRLGSAGARWTAAGIAFHLVAALVVVAARLWTLFAGGRPLEVPPTLAAFFVVPLLVWIGGLGYSAAVWLGGPILLALGLAWFVSRRMGVPNVTDRVYVDARARNRITRGLSVGLVATVAVLAVALVDSLGESIYRGGTTGRGIVDGTILGGAIALFSALAAPAAKVLPVILDLKKKRKRASIPSAVLTVLAFGIVIVVLSGATWVAHAIRWGFDAPSAPAGSIPRLLGAAVVLLLFCLLFGATWTFLNGSSQLPFYKARLARAYLGASNPRRRGRMGIGIAVPGDDLDFLAYHGAPPVDAEEPVRWSTESFSRGAPLHLVNVTVNDTKGGKSQVQQQDRKGLGFALGPCGLAVGRDQHVVFDRNAALHREPGDADPLVPIRYPVGDEATRSIFRVGSKSGRWLFGMERLTLGHWVAISGAAFSTGTGYRTSLGLSLLAGLGNIRLGYWCDAGREVAAPWATRLVRRLLAVQAYTLSEFRASFPGTSRRHWYLSDGGHFENLGGYELIRRRLPVIVLVDAEADPDFEFQGLANLVRKARIDFGAEVHFLDGDDLEEIWQEEVPAGIGTLAELKRADPLRDSRAHAAIAIVTYGGTRSWSLLLYVKASLTGDESMDLRQYHGEHPTFPHEPTSDQFFDEAQWESYRKLGEHIGSVLFGKVVTPWSPRAFLRPSGPVWDGVVARVRSEVPSAGTGEEDREAG